MLRSYNLVVPALGLSAMLAAAQFSLAGETPGPGPSAAKPAAPGELCFYVVKYSKDGVVLARWR